MNTGVAIILAVVILVVVVGAFMASSFFVGKAQDNARCEAWSANIEQKRAQIQSELFPDTESFNHDVNLYNAECAY